MGYIVQLLQAALKGGELARVRPVVLALLAPLMRLQELAGPALQPLSLEARKAFVMAKYVPLREQQVGAGLGA